VISDLVFIVGALFLLLVSIMAESISVLAGFLAFSIMGAQDGVQMARSGLGDLKRL